MHAVLISLLLLTQATADPRPQAPAPECLDARAVTQMRQLSPNTLIVASDERRFRIDVSQDCPDMASGSALLAQHGWVCGQAREFVQTQAQLCPIARIEEITSRDYSQLVRAADHNPDGQLLPTVESRSHRGATRGFRGSFDYCFRPSQMRAWAADDDGILIHTSKIRSGGHGAYRLELGGSCPQIAFLPVLSLYSGVGLDLICGNPGDAALLSDDRSSSPTADGLERGRSESRFAKVSERPCPIVAVYPVYE
jgi:hypothetical protein